MAYDSLTNPAAWTLAVLYFGMFVLTMVQVSGILRARHNPRSFLFVFLVLIGVYVPLRAVIVFADKTDSTSPIIILYLLPISLQITAFSLWALWFSAIEGGWSSCGVGVCRLPANFWVFILANVACLAMNGLVIVTTLTNTGSGALISLSIQLQQAFTALSFLALAVILAAYTMRFARLPPDLYNKSVLPRRPGVLVGLSTALVVVFALRAIYECLAASTVWQLRPFPPLLWTHAAFFIGFDLLPLALALSLTSRIPPPPSPGVPWGSSPRVRGVHPGVEEAPPTNFLKAALLGYPGGESLQAPPTASPASSLTTSHVSAAHSHGSSMLAGGPSHSKAAGASAPRPVGGGVGSYPSPLSGPLAGMLGGGGVRRIASRTSLGSGGTASSLEEARLMLPGSMQAASYSRGGGVLPGSQPGVQMGSPPWGEGGHRRGRGSSSGSEDQGASVGRYDSGMHLLRHDRYDVPVGSSLPPPAPPASRREAGAGFTTAAPATLAAQAAAGGIPGLNTPSPRLLMPGREGSRFDHQDQGLYRDNSPTTTNLMG